MNLFIHIGMQRTGSTFLQYSVFSQSDEINLVDFDKKNNELLGNKKIKNILTNIEKYDIKFILEMINKRLKNDKINLISEENINCKMFSKQDNRFVKLEKLKEVFPNAKIIFGTRKKDDLIVSWYTKYVMNGGIYNFNKYLEKIVNINKFNFQPYIKSLFEYYGNKNVFIYDLNELKSNKEDFLNNLCNFIGVNVPKYTDKKINVSYTLNQIKLSLFFNNFYKSEMNSKGFISMPDYYIPHKYIFRTNFFSNLPRDEITIKDLEKI